MDKVFLLKQIKTSLNAVITLFDNKLKSIKNLGKTNANKTVITDSDGNIVAGHTAWTMDNVVETLADSDMFNVVSIQNGVLLADQNNNVLIF